MQNLMNFPLAVFVLSFVVFWAMAQLGAHSLSGVRDLEQSEKDDFGFILGATLTLMGLIIGFAFSMAIGRYDQRKNYEEEEANAIGTEYVRADLLPGAYPEKIHTLLSKYLDQRILFYQTRDQSALRQIDADTAQLQNEMWSAVKDAALVQPTPVAALAVSGMNDVLNRQGYTQAAWWNRIPVAAWGFMAAIAICCNLLIGFTARRGRDKFRNFMLLVLPLVISISLLLLADLDSPRGGLIRVRPQNLLSLSQSLHP
jgi:hypothetical protein